MYNCVGTRVFGSSVEVFLGDSLGGGRGWEESIPVGISPGGSPVSSLVNSNGTRGRL